ncbi:MAG: hypothetical protein ACRDTF_10140, partial [Pseudonocardiaceae bacterium]
MRWTLSALVVPSPMLARTAPGMAGDPPWLRSLVQAGLVCGADAQQRHHERVGAEAAVAHPD